MSFVTCDPFHSGFVYVTYQKNYEIFHSVARAGGGACFEVEKGHVTRSYMQDFPLGKIYRVFLDEILCVCIRTLC